MKKLVIGLTLLLVTLSFPALAQVEHDFYLETATDTFSFWMQTPAIYDSTHPPALLIWWHHYGQSAHEMRDATNFPTLCNQRGWIAASFFGPVAGKHYQSRRGLHHADSLMNWVMSVSPFSRDSIYMVGGSMGGGAGMEWHDNYCGIHDFMAAAAVSGSGILDCELRQQQYVDSGHTLDAMRADFGGFPWDSDSIAYQYHRASAVRIPDTTKSMHFNALHLPVWNTWGTSDSCWSCEWFAYGRPAQSLDTMRRAEHADTTVTLCSGINGHGIVVLNQDSVVAWVSNFAANRFPAEISINAADDKEYYWTRVRRDTAIYVMGRYGVKRDFDQRRLDINLVRNVASLEVEFAFPWATFDSLIGTWNNFDRTVRQPQLLLTGVPAVSSVHGPGGGAVPFSYHADTLAVALLQNGNYKVTFVPMGTNLHAAIVPNKWRLVSAYPNPFNSQISLEIESPLAGKQDIRLYDITGRVAKTVTASLSLGTQRVIMSGDGLASGIYFVTIPKSGQAPLKIVLLK